jgi:hypothetical protein
MLAKKCPRRSPAIRPGQQALFIFYIYVHFDKCLHFKSGSGEFSRDYLVGTTHRSPGPYASMPPTPTKSSHSLDLLSDQLESSVELPKELPVKELTMVEEPPLVFPSEQQNLISLGEALELYMQEGSQLTMGDIANRGGLDVDQLRMHINR